jgi:hypothetical protein
VDADRLASTTAPTEINCFGEPVLTSTNQDSASELIWLPVVEITSAASSAASGRVSTEARPSQPERGGATEELSPKAE